MTSGQGGERADTGGEHRVAPVTIAVHEDDEPGCWTVEIGGEIDVASSSDVHEAIGSVVDDAERLTIDLSKTTFIDSSGLGVLVGAVKRAREQGHDGVRLRGLQEPVQRVFEITGLTELFELER